MSTNRDDVVRPILNLIRPRFLMLSDQAAIVLIDATAGNDSGLAMVAFGQSINEDRLLAVFDQRTVGNELLKIRSCFSIRRCRVGGLWQFALGTCYT